MLYSTGPLGVHLRCLAKRVDLEPSQTAVIHPSNRRIPATVLDMTPATAVDRCMKDRLGPDQETLVGRMARNAIDPGSSLHWRVTGFTIFFQARMCRRQGAWCRQTLPDCGVP